MRALGKQRRVQTGMTDYNQQVLGCIEAFRNTLGQCCDGVDRKRLQAGYAEVHAAEGHADDIRRELENMMYTEALFPESRGDILGLIEAMDRVPNQAEEAIRTILHQHIELPPEICPRLNDLVGTCCASVCTLVEGVDQLFSSFLDAAVTVGKIDKLESEADTIEAELTEVIFTADYPDLQKILLRDLVRHIGSVSDRAENAGDRIRIIVAKRSV